MSDKSILNRVSHISQKHRCNKKQTTECAIEPLYNSRAVGTPDNLINYTCALPLHVNIPAVKKVHANLRRFKQPFQRYEGYWTLKVISPVLHYNHVLHRKVTCSSTFRLTSIFASLCHVDCHAAPNKARGVIFVFQACVSWPHELCGRTVSIRAITFVAYICSTMFRKHKLCFQTLTLLTCHSTWIQYKTKVFFKGKQEDKSSYFPFVCALFTFTVSLTSNSQHVADGALLLLS